MKTIIKITMLLYGLGWTAVSQAQKRLSMGDRIPESMVNDLISSSEGRLTKARLNNKNIILYFWAASCKTCLKSFPKLDSLQQQFSDELQIVLVNHESKSKVENFLKPRIKIRLPNLPQLYERHDLREAFPYYTIPHVIWIDRSLKVSAITDNTIMSSTALRKLLDGVPQSVFYKNEVDRKFIGKKPAIEQDGNPYLKNLTYFSYFMPYNGDVPMTHRTSNTMINFRNTSILKLYEKAYEEEGKYQFWNANAVMISVKDSTPFKVPRDITYHEWKLKNLYTYELRVPEEKKGDLYKYMQKDLERCLPYRVKVEKRSIKCLVLVKLTNDLSIRSEGGKSSYRFSPPSTKDTMYFRNGNIQNFLRIINWTLYTTGLETNLSTPLVDATGIDYPVTLQINASIYNMEAFRKELQNNGLDLIEKDWEYPVLVIEDK